MSYVREPRLRRQDLYTALAVDYAATRDMADGQPLPPLIEDGVAWCVVRRANGSTLWRRLSLSPSGGGRHG